MAVDYDLVVIGSSAAGFHAAVMAAQLKARVALVDQQTAVETHGRVAHAVLREVGRTVHQVQRAEQLGICNRSEGTTLPAMTELWGWANGWSDAVSRNLDAIYSLSTLAALGVEVISGCGEFYRKPALGFVVNGRPLRSRTYLLAVDQRPTIPDIPGLQTAGYRTVQTVLAQRQSLSMPKSVLILGSHVAGTELAQVFVRLGAEVTLVINEPHILPQEDPEAARLLQAQLEAEGVRILAKTQVTQVRQIAGKKWVQAGNHAIEVDEILLATEPLPDLEALNLEAANVRWNGQGLSLNDKLQTTNAKIYACTGTAHVARYQASVAVKNALFLPLAKATSKSVAEVVKLEPELARVGLTEPQAREQYGKAVVVLRQFFQALTQAQVQGETTGVCKLLVHRNGSILGAHIVGMQASEIIGSIALAMEQNLKIQTLAQLTIPSPTFSEIVSQTAAEWHRLYWERHSWQRDWLEGLFNFRRSTSRS